MSKKGSQRHKLGGLSRRSLLQSTAVMLSIPVIANATSAWAQEKLAGSGEVVVFSYGGSFTDGLRRNVYGPFTKATGIKIVEVVADIAEPQVKAMNRAGRIDWDVAYIDDNKYPVMHEAGMFEPLDYTLWDAEALDGVPKAYRLSDAVVAFETSTPFAYDRRAFPNAGPQNWADFWDVKTFQGPRGLEALNVRHNIVFALAADGVAHKDIWPLTDDKIERALKKLDELKANVAKWWTAGGEPPQLLINREYAMSSANAGRLLVAVRQGAPLQVVWDGANKALVYQAILKGGPNRKNAQKLIAFVNRAQIAAGFTEGSGYPGPNTNLLKYVPTYLSPLLSIHPDNAPKTITEDSSWLSAERSDGKTNVDHIQERWLKWKMG
ncbi:ABC transporter substrate-binding protein [Bradyrhizobium sp. 172]|uniref:ABC transporter substrate-binding protein n=1 Tax=Bradyrhizobium sp. 172 TaxID=2782643 RepID=UPI0020000859|nr:ABC transporter substrate-binding protein [Bradyrhizobium sp. 172]UPJ94924.1 ABC transporter substrate-binding protein [Bradyrhizobium sp. 172]